MSFLREYYRGRTLALNHFLCHFQICQYYEWAEYFFFLNLFIYIFIIYLAASGLSCTMADGNLSSLTGD